MSTSEALEKILKEQQKTNNKLTKIEARLKQIEADIIEIKDCVSSENAKEFPALKGSGSNNSKHAMAAKSH